MSELSNEDRKKRIENIVKVVGLLVAGFIVAPFIFTAIQGLIGLAVAAGVGLSIIYMTPVIAMKMANWRIKLITSEATKNPIPSLQNEYNRQSAVLADKMARLKEFATEVKSFAGEVVGFSKRYPEKAATYKEQQTKMELLLESRMKKWQEAKQKLDEFDLCIQETEAEWKLSQSALAVNRKSGESDEEFFAKLSTKAALDSVKKSMASAMTELDMCMMEETVPHKSMLNTDIGTLDKNPPNSVARSKIAV